MRGGRKAVSLGGTKRYPRLAAGALDGTPERLAKAAETGAVEAEAGTRRLADPFDLYRKRGKLDAADPATNACLWEAGERFRRHWHGSRMDGLTAFDMSRVSVDTGAGQGLPPGEAALRHRQVLAAAQGAVGPRHLPVLQAIVVDGAAAGALAGLVRDTAHPRTAEALVMERLREALHRLVDLWGMVPGLAPRPGRPFSPAPCRDSAGQPGRAPP